MNEPKKTYPQLIATDARTLDKLLTKREAVVKKLAEIDDTIKALQKSIRDAIGKDGAS